jgi:hypothetical protein
MYGDGKLPGIDETSAIGGLPRFDGDDIRDKFEVWHWLDP